MSTYIPPLRFHSLTPLYDSAVRLTTNEQSFRTTMLKALREGRPPLKVLDIGCGTGSYALLLKQEYPDARIVGIDADEQALSIARRKAAALKVAIDFRQADARQLPLPEASFDAAYSSLFFHHLNDAEKVAVLRQVHRCLAPGGKLVVADWHRPTTATRTLGFALVRLLDGFAVTRMHSNGSFPLALESAGFQISDQVLVDAPLGSIGVWTCVRHAQE